MAQPLHVLSETTSAHMRSDVDGGLVKVSGRNGGLWRRAAAAVQPAAALKTRVRIPFGKLKRNTSRKCGSRRPAVPVTGGIAAGVLCLVLRFCVLSSVDRGRKEKYEDETRHPSTGCTDGGGGC